MAMPDAVGAMPSRPEAPEARRSEVPPSRASASPVVHVAVDHRQSVRCDPANTIKDLVGPFAPIDVEAATIAFGRGVVVATFTRVHDAMHAAIALAAASLGDELRIAVDLASPGCHGMEPVLRLVSDAAAPAVAVGCGLAPAAGLTLPAGTALVARCDGRGGELAPVAAYELRLARPNAPACRPADTSNLAWAHRAARTGAPAGATELDAAWHGALAAGPATAVVTSPAGRAATTAAAGLALRAHAGGALVLRGAWDAAPRRPGGAWREALLHHAAVARMGPPFTWRWSGAPEQPLTAPPVPDTWPPDDAFAEALGDWLRARSRRQPVLGVLDHAQWADEWSRELWVELADQLTAAQVLLAMVGARGVGAAAALDGLLETARALDPRAAVIALHDG